MLKKQKELMVLENFKQNATPEIKELIDVLMKLHLDNEAENNVAKLSISVGINKGIDCFVSHLTAHSTAPYVVISSWNNRPQIAIKDKNIKMDNTYAVIDLSDICNVTIEKYNTSVGCYNITYHSVTNNLDYNLHIMLKEKFEL